MGKPAKRRGNKPSPEFARARAAIGQHGSILRGLGLFKLASDRTQIRRVVPQLLEHPAYKHLIWPDATPRTYAKLVSPGIPGYLPIDREIEWAIQTLLPHSGAIQQFLDLRRESDEALLLGDREEHQCCITKIKEQFGVSLWLLQAELNAIARTEGLAQQKQFAQEILSDPSLGSLIKFIVTWLSFRSEQNISAREFRKTLFESLPDEEDGLVALTHIILGECPTLTAKQAGEALAFTDLFPVVDRYYYCLAIAQAYVAGNADAEALTAIGNSVQFLRRSLADPALDRLAAACGMTVEPISDNSILVGALDAYSSGSYEQTLAMTGALASETGSIDAIQLSLRATLWRGEQPKRLNLPDKSLLAEIASDLEQVISFSAAAPEAASRLSKVALTHCSSAWASTLSLVTLRQSRDERIFAPTPRQIFDALRSDERNPIHAFCFEPHRTADAVLNLLTGSNLNSVTRTATEALLANEATPAFENLSDVHRQKLDAILALRRNDASTAIRLLEPMYRSRKHHFSRMEAGLHLAEALLRAHRLRECARVCAELFMEAPYLGSLLPIRSLVDALIEQEENTSRADYFLGSLPVVLVFDIYSRHVSPDRDAERADAFRDFLTAQGVKHASELADRAAELNAAQFIHFLRYVCVPEVLDQSLTLKTSREVEDERAKILVLLSDLISARGDTPPAELLEELQEIRTKQVIRDTTLQLDQSKIYVDVPGIRKSIGSLMKDNWNRYRLLTIQSDAGSIEDIYRSIESALDGKYTVVSLSLPVTERNKLFARMVGELRTQFTSSKIFGLDANLSTNIRHGFVLREIRKPFVTSRLVTKKATASGGYQENDYWIDRLEIPARERAAFVDAMNRFSGAVDQEIEELVGTLLRIKNEENPDGLFDFTLPDPVLQLMQRRVELLENYDEFLEFVFTYLWDRTEKNLRIVRDTLHSQTLVRLQSALNSLQQDVEHCCSAADVSDLVTAINLVRPEVRHAVDRIASWFTMSGSRDYQDFPLRIAFDAGLATVASYYGDLNIKTEFVATPQFMMSGWTLPYFTRLFTIVMENAAEHSGIKDGQLAINCVAELKDGYLDVRIANALSTGLIEEDLSNRVQRLNSEFGRDAASDYVQREGNSGYPKIWKILKHDLDREHEIHVQITEDREFVLELMMDAANVVVWEADSADTRH